MPNLAVTYSPPAGKTVVNLSGTITADAQFIQQPVSGEQIVFNSGTSLTVSPQLVIAGDTGTYEVWHVKLNGEVEKLSYFIGSIYTNVTFSAGANYTTATIANEFDPYVFQNWPQGEPQAGWQLTTLTADGYFDAGGNFYSDVEKVLPCWVTDLNGLVTHITIDSTLIGVATDITPDAFSFTDQSGVNLLTLTESNAVTVSGVTAATDVAVSVTGGEYAISTDGGSTYASWTSAAGTIQLSNLIKLRVTSSGEYSTGVSSTLTIGGVSDTWTVTTLSSDVSPDQFVFNDISNATISTVYESNSITVTGVSPGIDIPISIVGGEYSISTDGTNYSAYTSSVGTIQLNNLVKVRHSSSTSYSTQVTTTLTIGGVSDSFSTTTESETVAIDRTPDEFTFSNLILQPISTVVESEPVTVQGLTPNEDIAISVTGGEYAISTDGGATYSAWSSSPGTIQNTNFLKLRLTTSGSYSTQSSAVVNVGTYGVSWFVTTASQPISQFTIYDTDLQVNRFYGDPYRCRVEDNSSNWISFYLYNAGALMDLSNMTDCKIELVSFDGLNTYESILSQSPNLFKVVAGSGRIDVRMGRIGAIEGNYYLDLVYYDASHVNGAYMSVNRKIIVEMV